MWVLGISRFVLNGKNLESERDGRNVRRGEG